MSIKLKLTILFLAIALIPTLLIVAISFQNYRNSIENTNLAALQHLTVYKTETIQTYFAGLKDNIETAQAFYNIKKNLPILTRFAYDPNNPEFIAAKKMLDGQLQPTEKSLALHDIMLTGPDGRVVYSTNPKHYAREHLKPLPDPDQKAFVEGKKGIYFSDIFIWEGNGDRPEMLLTAPATDSNGTFLGVIAFEIDMTPIYALIQDTTGLGRTGETLVGQKIGNQAVYLNPLRHDPEAALKRKINLGEPAAYPVQQAVQGKTGAGISVDYRGKKVIAAWRYIPSLDWGLVAKIDAQEAFADVANLQKLVAIVLVLIFLLAGLMAFSIARSIAEPVNRLALGAEIIGSGNLDYKVATDSKDEIGRLSRSFDKMTHDLRTTTASRDELNREVIERKHAEQALRESQADLSRAQAVAHVGSWRLDVRQNILTWSDEAYRIFGIPTGVSLTYEKFLESVHPDDRDYLDRKWKAALAGEPYDIEHRIIVGGESPGEQSRTIKWVREKAELEFDKDGQLLGGFGTVQDITARKQADEALRQSESRHRSIVSTALDGFWQTDLQGRITDVNPAACQMLGYSREELLKMRVADIEAVENPEDVKRHIQKMIATGGDRFESRHKHKDGTIINVEVSTSFVKDTQGERIFAFIHDITERKQAEVALRKAHDELEMRVKERTAQLTQTVGTLQEEVMQRQHAEQALRSASLYARSLIEASPDPLVTISPEGKITDVNEATEVATGIVRDGLIGSNFSNYFTEPQKASEGYRKVISDGFVTDYPLTIRHVSGSTMDVLYNATVYKNEAGEIQGVFAAARDVTEQKQAQKALGQSEERYRSLTVATTQIVWTTAPNGQVVGDLPSWREFTGQTIDEIQGWGWINSLHPDDRDRTAAIWSEAVRTCSIYQIEYRMRRHDGEYRHFTVRGVPVMEADAHTIREWIGTCTDITERKLAQQRQAVTSALLELFARKTSRKEYLDSTVEAIRQWSDCEFAGIRIKDGAGNIPYESYVGFDKEFLALENDLNLERDNCVCIRAMHKKAYQDDRKYITDGGSFYVNDSQALLKSLSEQQLKEYRGNCIKKGFLSIAVVPIRYGTEVLGAIHLTDYKKDMVLLPKIQFIESTIAPLIGEAVQRFNAEAELEQYRLHLEDLVEQRTEQLEKEVVHRKLIAEDLARSNKDLEQFAYVASHDLQEPLRAVAGFVELLKMKLDKTLDNKSTEYIGHTIDGVKRMQALINGLLEYSRIETRGKKPELVDAKVALDHALAHLHMSINESGAKITAARLPQVHFDHTQLAQLFQNLVSNAIKFRGDQPPQINITANHTDDAWQFAVADNGIGIEPQYVDRIFLIFQRLHTRSKYPGTGIGLAVCKKIVERHNGKIWVESKAGTGSTFYFTIPDKGETS